MMAVCNLQLFRKSGSIHAKDSLMQKLWPTVFAPHLDMPQYPSPPTSSPPPIVVLFTVPYRTILALYFVVCFMNLGLITSS